MAVAVFDDHGQSVFGQKGELVCTQAFPAMPIGFWGDGDGVAYCGPILKNILACGVMVIGWK
jgi:acyl-coenzyme A synthetase/AMP-(fatty) acid ligase